MQLNETSTQVNIIETDNFLRVYVCVPFHFIASRKVSYDWKISVLKSILPANSSIIFICNGKILDENSTFQQVNIQPNDSIFVTSKGQQNHWIKFTKNDDRVDTLINEAVNSRTTRESGRLRDIRMMRNESKKRFFSKMMRILQDNFIEANVQTTVVDNIHALNENPLPVIW